MKQKFKLCYLKNRNFLYNYERQTKSEINREYLNRYLSIWIINEKKLLNLWVSRVQSTSP